MSKRSITGRVRRLHETRDTDPASALSPSERVALVWTLTMEGWSLAGHSMPTYTRAETPVVKRSLASTRSLVDR